MMNVVKRKLIAGMYGVFTPPRYSPAQVSRDMARYLTAVFSWTAFCLVAAGAVATLISRADVNPALLEGYVPLVVVMASMWFFFLTAKYVMKSSFLAYVLCLAYWSALGASVELLFRAYQGPSAAAYFIAAGVAFGLLALWQRAFSRPLSFATPDAYVVAAVALALASGLLFVIRGTWPEYLFAAVGTISAVGVAVHNLDFLRSRNKVGNEGTAADIRERVEGSLIVYLQMMVLFLAVLKYAPKAGSGKSASGKKKSSFGGGSFGGGGARSKW